MIMEDELIRMKRQRVVLHLKDNKYVSIIQDVGNTIEIAIMNDKGIDSDTVQRYLNAQELAFELLKLHLDR